MITTAAYILADAYESTHNDDYNPDAPGRLLMLVIFLAFDYSMAQVLF